MTIQVRYLIVFILSLCFVSCNKESHTASKLSGKWQITYYKRTNPNNWIEYGKNLVGTIFFENNNSKGTFQQDITYSFADSNYNSKENGSFEVIEKGGFINLSAIEGTNNVPSLTYRILTLTRTDLQLEFRDKDNYLHNYLFVKMK